MASASPGSPRNAASTPKITIGLLTEVTGMPLMVDAFEGNRAETKTMIPPVQRFVAAHGIGVFRFVNGDDADDGRPHMN
jgi:transposase